MIIVKNVHAASAFIIITNRMISKAIQKAFQVKKERKWIRMYWAFDIHDTILVPNYNALEIPKEFYPQARETLQLISSIQNIVMILFTSSSPEDLKEYIRYFRENRINFDYANENPEVRNANYGCYDVKPYFNVLFDDKAGFDPASDWKITKDLVQEYYKNESII
jgi:hypothetical protein